MQLNNVMLPRAGVGVAPPPVQPPLQIPLATPLTWMPLGESNRDARDTCPASMPNVIDDDCNKTIANVFCYSTFADCYLGVVYNNFMGNFPFVLFGRSICYLVT